MQNKRIFYMKKLYYTANVIASMIILTVYIFNIYLFFSNS